MLREIETLAASSGPCIIQQRCSERSVYQIKYFLYLSRADEMDRRDGLKALSGDVQCVVE